jgi:hypothetical protein
MNARSWLCVFNPWGSLYRVYYGAFHTLFLGAGMTPYLDIWIRGVGNCYKLPVL